MNHHRPNVYAVLLGAAALIASSAASGDAAAQAPCPSERGCVTAPSEVAHTRVDPRLYTMRAALDKFGPSAMFPGTDTVLDPHGVGVSLRMARALDRDDAAKLELSGIVLRSVAPDGTPRGLGQIYRVWIAWSDLERLEEIDGLVYAEAGWLPGRAFPDEETSRQVGAYQANILPELGVTGAGVTIADIDSGIDVLHPAFFRADGDRFVWQDLDGDGAFTGGGSDVVDYNGDGAISSTEVLVLLDGAEINFYSGNQMPVGRDEILQADTDWLFLDLNGNGVRDAGPGLFTEDTPAYGEPIFVVDDVDGDNELGPREHLVQLKTSKFARFQKGDQQWVRGVNLIDSAVEDVLADSSHGTGVAGILAGGQHGYHKRVGLAPDADLLAYSWGDGADWVNSDDDSLAMLEGAVLQGADIVLHEWNNPCTRAHDGSSNFEAAMDAAHQMGVVQVNPLGNLNKARKHIERDLVPGIGFPMPFNVSADGFNYGGQFYPYTTVFGTFQWEGTQRLGFSVTSPSGQVRELPIDGNANGIAIDGAWMQASRQITTRGNSLVTFFVYSEDALPTGTWIITPTNVTEPVTMQARVCDYFSSWSVGVDWAEPTEDRGTMCFPSTADSAIGVAAYGGRWDLVDYDGTRRGELRNFSGRGPRLDGAHGVDITAPDDPFAPLSISREWLRAGYQRGWYSTFGGTSGAGPHVAATAALLLEQDPTRTADEITALITSSASLDGVMVEGELPDIHWGAGKLDAYAALYQEQPRENQRPDALVTVRREGDMIVFDASQSSDPDMDALQARFDTDYDGVFESAWVDGLVFEVRADELEEGERVARVSVRDELGAEHGALLVYDLSDFPDVVEPDMGASTPPDMGRAPGEEDMGSPDAPADMGGATPDVDMSAPGADGPDSPELPGGESSSFDDDDERGCAGCGQAPGDAAPGQALLSLLVGALFLRRRRRA